MIGDADPEDAYDASDPLDVRLATLAKVAAALVDPAAHDRGARLAALAVVLRRLADELDGTGP